MDQKFPDHLPGRLRACLACSQIKPQSAFKKDGCENCEELRMRGSAENVAEATSKKFSGFIGLVQPERSWVAKWQPIRDYRPGMYALTVEGILPEEFVVRMEQKGKVYISREESFKME